MDPKAGCEFSEESGMISREFSRGELRHSRKKERELEEEVRPRNIRECVPQIGGWKQLSGKCNSSRCLLTGLKAFLPSKGGETSKEA